MGQRVENKLFQLVTVLVFRSDRAALTIDAGNFFQGKMIGQPHPVREQPFEKRKTEDMDGDAALLEAKAALIIRLMAQGVV
ncbi:MAG: hypothetical protein BWY83_00827 [bacterium ADurb.Bin478]|nr:MAG: hypothetical protein BWY83_00827 [bacterium ADurb.Bin478]